MAIIITKPEFFKKNGDNLLKISRDDIKAIPMVATHIYFKKIKNWKHITLNFMSIPSNQIEVVNFDGTLLQPEGIISVSSRARNTFQIQSIVLHDFDNGWLTIPRESLPVIDMDFVFDSRYDQPNLSIALQNKSNAILSWTQVEETDASTQYLIYKKVGAGDYSLLTTITGSLTYTDTNLLPDTTYSYKVEINDFVKYMPATDQEAVTPTRPATPQNLTGSTTPGQVTLNWSAVVGTGITYRVFRATTSNGQTTPLISGLTNPTYIDNTVVGGTTYYYKVKSYDGFESDPSNEINIMPMGTFTSIASTALNSTTARVIWTSVGGAQIYQINYRVQGTTAWTTGPTAPGSNTSVDISGLVSGTTYQFTIIASNASNSVQSGITTTTLP